MEKQLYSIEEVTKLINDNNTLVITADEALLTKLPKGNWIGGTLPYFMTDNGYTKTTEKLYVNDLTSVGTNFEFIRYDVENISTVATNNFANGFAFIIMPAGSAIHGEFSLNSLEYENILSNPVVGFASGFDFEATEKSAPKVFLGTTGEVFTNSAVAIHVELPANQIARVEIITPYSIDENSAEIHFPENSFVQSKCTVNGKDENIFDYLTSIGYQMPGVPFISDNHGALINRSVLFMNPETKTVGFHSPVFAGNTYRLANKVNDYKALFADKLTINKKEAVYSCLCYGFKLAANFENEVININGPFVFNEIAYQALNETAIYLMIDRY